MHRISRFWRILAILSVLAAAVFSMSLPAGAQPAESRLQGQLAINSTQDNIDVAAKRPWTRAELLAAIPLDDSIAFKQPTAADQAAAAKVIAAAGSATAPSGAVAGGMPDKIARAAVVDSSLVGASTPNVANEIAAFTAVTGQQASVPQAGADVSPQVIAGPQGYPGAYTRYEVFTGIAHPRTYVLYPYSTQGKVFFRQPDIQDGIVKSWVCSASVQANGSIITAGHCVHAGRFAGNGWSTNFVFVPAYKDGAAPLGQWTPRFLRTFTAWYTSRNFARDVGGASLNRDSLGRTVSQFTGWLGIAWNWGYNQHYNSFGYPQAAPFNGQRLDTCEGSLAYYDTAYTPATKAIGCDMTGGSSGGGWIKNFGTGNYLNGLNSYKRIINGVTLTQEMFSPHFDTAVKTVIWDCVALNVGC